MGCSQSKPKDIVENPIPVEVTITSKDNHPSEEDPYEAIQRTSEATISPPIVNEPELPPDQCPSVGFVIKTHQVDNKFKVFVNVLYHPFVENYILAGEPKWSTDKKDDSCWCYKVIISKNRFDLCSQNLNIEYEQSQEIITFMNTELHEKQQLSLDIKIPRMKKGFVGDLEEIYQIKIDKNGFIIEKNEESITDEQKFMGRLISIDVNKRSNEIQFPSLTKGWLNKKGHVLPTWKSRFFVLENGFMYYYMDETKEPPFGEDLKGKLSLAGYQVVSDENDKVFNIIHLQKYHEDNQFHGSIIPLVSQDKTHEDFYLEAKNPDEKNYWIISIQEHCRYAERKNPESFDKNHENIRELEVLVEKEEEQEDKNLENIMEDEVNIEKEKEIEVSEHKKPDFSVKTQENPSKESIPPLFCGFLQKRGHVVKNWKLRYFVLEKGILFYYENKSELDEPPYGEDLKGKLNLAGYEVVFEEKDSGNRTLSTDTFSEKRRNSSVSWTKSNIQDEFVILLKYQNNQPMRRGSFLPLASQDKTHVDFFIETKNLEDKLNWINAIKEHTVYAEKDLNMDSNKVIVEEEVIKVNEIIETEKEDIIKQSENDLNNSNKHTKEKEKSLPIAEKVTKLEDNIIKADKAGTEWHKFLQPDEKLVLTGLVGKPNPVGIKYDRQLILTSKKRLIYVCPVTMEFKGEIVWSMDKKEKDLPSVGVKNYRVLEVWDKSRNRTFLFYPRDKTKATDWMLAISSV